MTILGAVLAGGRSRRFGSNKALALFEAEPLIAHAARSLGRQVDAVVICGGEVAVPGLRRLSDRPCGGLGPLGGLAAALHHANANGFDGVVSAGCDTPMLPPTLVEWLRACGGAAYVGETPLIGWWPSDLAERLDTFVERDPRRSIRGWAAAVGAREVYAEEAIANINTPGDLALLGTRRPLP